jgi:hypothetical protein
MESDDGDGRDGEGPDLTAKRRPDLTQQQTAKRAVPAQAAGDQIERSRGVTHRTD